MSLQALGVTSGQLSVRLGLVGSLSTFLPKDSCLGAQKSGTWNVTPVTLTALVGVKAVGRQNAKSLSMQLGACYCNTPGVLCFFFGCDDEFRVSQQFESTKINWMRVLKKDGDFRVDEDK